MDQLANHLSTLRPEHLFPTWCYVDYLERRGEISAEEATHWKHGIFGLMLLWDLEPDDLIFGRSMADLVRSHPADGL